MTQFDDMLSAVHAQQIARLTGGVSPVYKPVIEELVTSVVTAVQTAWDASPQAVPDRTAEDEYLRGYRDGLSALADRVAASLDNLVENEAENSYYTAPAKEE